MIVTALVGSYLSYSTLTSVGILRSVSGHSEVSCCSAKNVFCGTLQSGAAPHSTKQPATHFGDYRGGVLQIQCLLGSCSCGYTGPRPVKMCIHAEWHLELCTNSKAKVRVKRGLFTFVE